MAFAQHSLRLTSYITSVQLSERRHPQYCDLNSRFYSDFTSFFHQYPLSTLGMAGWRGPHGQANWLVRGQNLRLSSAVPGLLGDTHGNNQRDEDSSLFYCFLLSQALAPHKGPRIRNCGLLILGMFVSSKRGSCPNTEFLVIPLRMILKPIPS